MWIRSARSMRSRRAAARSLARSRRRGLSVRPMPIVIVPACASISAPLVGYVLWTGGIALIHRWNDTDGPPREVSAQHGFLLYLISSTYARREEAQGAPGGRGPGLVLRRGRVAPSLAVGRQPADRHAGARGRH